MPNCNVQFMRIDTRMVHGQIVTKWATVNHCKHVIIIDKALDADPFMANFYKKAAQKGVKIDVSSPVKATKAWNKESFGPAGRNAMIVFKDATNVYNLWKEGFPIKEVDIGNQVAGNGKKQISREVFLSDDEFAKLKEMYEGGVRVYMQIIPEDSPMEFPEVEKKFNS